jgi:hypothetical protein
VENRLDTVDGCTVRVFLPGNHDELVAITKWCKTTIGRSHGWHSIWYVRSTFHRNSMTSKKEVVIKHGPHMSLLLLTWG